MTDAAPKAKAKTLTAPVDLETIKDDLGMPADDTTNDAWLQRRIDELWAHFQNYTGRPLLLESGWVDDWGEMATSAPAHLQPGILQPRPRGSVYLRVFPVAAITKITVNGADGDAAGVMFDKSSGKLLSLSGPPSVDLGTLLLGQRARIEYTAGFAELPPPLYSALIGALQVQWNSRNAASGGIGVGGFLPTRISAIDVGEVDLSLAPNVFVDQASRRAGSTDPLLGPYASVLDTYVDYRSILGGALPTTEPLPVPP